jgi:hypothetical protein
MEDNLSTVDIFDFNIDGIENDGVFTLDDMTSTDNAAPIAADVKGDEVVKETFEVELAAPKLPAVEETKREEAPVFEVNDKPSPESAPSSPLLTRLASALYKDGVLSGVDEQDIKDVDVPKLADLIKKTISHNEFSGLDERAKQALEAIRAGVPVENVIKHHNTGIKLAEFTEDRFVENDLDTDESSEEKLAVRKSLIYNDLIARGFDQRDAERRTAQSFKAGDDVADARLALQSLKRIAEVRRQEEIQQAKSEQKRQEDTRQQLFTNVAGMKEVIPGLPVSQEVSKWMAEAMTSPTGRTQDGRLRTVVSDKRSEDPFKFDTRLHYFIKMGLFDEKPDMSFLAKRNMSSAIQELEKNLSNEGVYDGGRGASLESITEREMKNRMFNLLDGVDI